MTTPPHATSPFPSDRFSEKIQKLFDFIPCTLFSRNGTITHLNPAAERCLQIPRDVLLDRTFSRAGYRVLDGNGHRLPLRDHPWIQAAHAGRPCEHVLVGLAAPHQPLRWFQVSAVPVHIIDGRKIATALGIFSDVTVLYRSHIQLIQTQKMDALHALIGGLTHDFNTVLTNIRSHLQTLYPDCPPDHPLREQLREMEQEVLRGAELIRQLLVFIKPDKTRLSTRVNERLNQLRRLLRRILPRAIRLDVSTAPEEMAARIGPAQFDQIMLNLAINARNAMPRGGTLRITAAEVTRARSSVPPFPEAKPGTYVRMDVADTGVGIPPNILPKIFDPFFTTKPDGKGTGLGLTIVHSLVRKAGGHIQVESAPGTGTVFSFYLPARHVRASRRPKEKVGKETVDALFGSETILVAEDEPLLNRSLTAFLQRYGYEVLTASDGRKAVELFRRHRDEVALVLLDLEMPEISGHDCLAALMDQKPDIKVVAVSGAVLSVADWDPVRKGGARAFLAKPFDFQELLALIRRVLDSPR